MKGVLYVDINNIPLHKEKASLAGKEAYPLKIRRESFI